MTDKGPRDDRWYLRLMAPNTKGEKFAWLDPTSIYINAAAFHDLLDDLEADLAGVECDVVAGLDGMPRAHRAGVDNVDADVVQHCAGALELRVITAHHDGDGARVGTAGPAAHRRVDERDAPGGQRLRRRRRGAYWLPRSVQRCLRESSGS